MKNENAACGSFESTFQSKDGKAMFSETQLLLFSDTGTVKGTCAHSSMLSIKISNQYDCEQPISTDFFRQLEK